MGKFLDPITPVEVRRYLMAPMRGAARTVGWRCRYRQRLRFLDLNCTGAGAQDALYVRFQARPEVAAISIAERDRIALTDCLGDQVPLETIDPVSGRVGAGIPRRMVTNVFALAPNSVGRLALYCNGSGGGGNSPFVEDVVEFKVFYRLDDAAYLAGAGGATNAAPLGGSVRDATLINALSSAIVDPWNYVVAVMVCVTVRTNETGVATACPPIQLRDVPLMRPRHRRGWRWSGLILRAECCIARTRRFSRFARKRRRLRR